MAGLEGERERIGGERERSLIDLGKKKEREGSDMNLAPFRSNRYRRLINVTNVFRFTALFGQNVTTIS